MSPGPRLVVLLEKEQSGALSLLEREELERLVRLEPDVRRERAAWQRLRGALARDAERAPGLDPTALAARVLAEHAARGGRPRPRSSAPGSATGAVRGTWAAAVAVGVALTALLAWPEGQGGAPEGPAPRPAQARGEPAESPVEISLGGGEGASAAAAASTGPVDIRF